jgi:hypothetical protein
MSGFQILIAVFINTSIFWDITPCDPLKVNRRFGRTYGIHIQGQRLNQARNQRGADSKQPDLEYQKYALIPQNVSIKCTYFVYKVRIVYFIYKYT